VHRPDDAISAVGLGAQAAHQRAVLVRQRVADGVGDVERRRAGLDRRRQHLDEKGGLAAGGVLRAHLDVLAQLAAERDRVAHLRHHLRRRHAELPFHVERRGGDEGVDARSRRAFEGAPGAVDVVAAGAGEGGDDGRVVVGEGTGDLGHTLEVVGARRRKAGLDDVDAEAGELARHEQLLGAREAGAGALLAVAQRGVEDAHWVNPFRPVRGLTGPSASRHDVAVDPNLAIALSRVASHRHRYSLRAFGQMARKTETPPGSPGGVEDR
jgi:hypothetical protein